MLENTKIIVTHHAAIRWRQRMGAGTAAEDKVKDLVRNGRKAPKKTREAVLCWLEGAIGKKACRKLAQHSGNRNNYIQYTDGSLRVVFVCDWGMDGVGKSCCKVLTCFNLAEIETYVERKMQWTSTR